MIWNTSIKETTGSWICSCSKLTEPWPLLIRLNLNQHNSFFIFRQRERRSNGATDKTGGVLIHIPGMSADLQRRFEILTKTHIIIIILHWPAAFPAFKPAPRPPEGEAQSLGGVFVTDGLRWGTLLWENMFTAHLFPGEVCIQTAQKETKEGRKTHECLFFTASSLILLSYTSESLINCDAPPLPGMQNSDGVRSVGLCCRRGGRGRGLHPSIRPLEGPHRCRTVHHRLGAGIKPSGGPNICFTAAAATAAVYNQCIPHSQSHTKHTHGSKPTHLSFYIFSSSVPVNLVTHLS